MTTLVMLMVIAIATTITGAARVGVEVSTSARRSLLFFLRAELADLKPPASYERKTNIIGIGATTW